MRRTRRACCKILLCIAFITSIIHLLLTVAPVSHDKNEIIRLENSNSFWKKAWSGKVSKNLTLPSQLYEFQKFYNRNNRIELTDSLHVKLRKDKGSFNASYLNLTRNRLGGTDFKILTLPSSLANFERYYNTQFQKDTSIIQYGHVNGQQGFLTIGIPTVKRRYNGDNYLFTTINSLISNIGENSTIDVVIVIFTADLDDSWNIRISGELYKEFRSHVESGLLQIIKAPAEVYPDLSKLEKTKHDSADRVQWRSKQNIDFAFLMLYCQNLSSYYIQLEDDVLVAPGFIKDIEKFTVNYTHEWVCLEFSTLGFIGKMFHSSDLRIISAFLLTHFSDMPCDLLLGKIISFLGQKSPIHSPVSLFQHIGKISSLRNKMMPSIDRLFKGIGSNVLSIMKLPNGEHPAAKFRTNMKIIPGYPPENIYKTDSYFWASHPRSKQFLKIIYEHPINISRLLISTGENINKTDIIENGILKVGTIENINEECSSVKEVGKFVDGEFDSLIQGVALPVNVRCLHIEAKKSQKHWLIIRQIEIFRNKTFPT